MPSPETPDWFRPDDPWLSTRMRQIADIAAAERDIGRALEKALSLFLAAAATRLLDAMPPRGAVTAAAIPDTADWPERERNWFALVERFVRAVLAAIFGRRFRAELRSVTVEIDLDAFTDAYLDDVWQRLRLLPEIVFAEIREEIDASIADGDRPARTRARVRELLRIGAPSRSLARRLAALQRAIDDPATKDSVRREARARLAALRRRDEADAPGDSRWFSKLRELARTEAVSVLNAATAAAAAAYTRLTGRRRWRQWWAVRDDRVRPAHRRAHRQTRPVGEDFDVGGFTLRYPGDPLAPADLVVNCRCSLLSMGEDAGRREQAEWERSQLGQTSPVDTGRITAASGHTGGVGMATATETTDPDERQVPPDPSVNQPVPEDPDRVPPDGNALDDDRELFIPYASDGDDSDVLAPLIAAGRLPEDATQVRWRGVLAPMGVRSGDNRMIAPPPGAPQHRILPLPLLYQRATADGHDNSVVVGNITRVWSQDGLLMGEGTFDLGDEDGREAVRKIDGGFHRWVSVRLDNESREYHYYRDGLRIDADELLAMSEGEHAGIEMVGVSTDWRLMSATLVAEPAFQEAAIGLLDDDDEIVEPVAVAADAGAFAPSADKRKRAEDSGAAMPGGRYPIENMDDLRKAIQAVGRAGGKDGTDDDRNAVRRHIIKRAKAIGKAFIVPKNWNADGTLKKPSAAALLADAQRRSWYQTVASVVPLEPPATWFADPELTGPTKIRVTDEGRVYGHIAAWGTPHAGLPGTVVPPHDPATAYNKFHRHPVRCSDGSRVKTGPLAGHGHAADERGMPANLPLWQVQAHYDNPEYVLADVVVGEDAHGIWCSGALRPGVSAQQVMYVDRYSFSGDWRGGELLAACLASVPGFHLDADDAVQALAADAGAELVLAEATPRMRIEDGEVVALVAAGYVPPPRSPRTGGVVDPGALGLLTEADPHELGLALGRGMFAGMRQAEAEAAEALLEQQRRDALVAEFARRLNAPLAARVQDLSARVHSGPVGGA